MQDYGDEDQMQDEDGYSQNEADSDQGNPKKRKPKTSSRKLWSQIVSTLTDIKDLSYLLNFGYSL